MASKWGVTNYLLSGMILQVGLSFFLGTDFERICVSLLDEVVGGPQTFFFQLFLILD